MKFLVTKDLAHSSLLGKLMAGVCMALFFYLGLDVILHAYVLGEDVKSIQTTLYGNTEEFIEPILFDTLLLQVHSDLFMMLFTILIIASIYIRLYSTKVMTKWLVHGLFVFGLLAPLCLLVAYANAEVFVYIWLATFVPGHLLGMGMAWFNVKKLVFR